MYRGCIGSPSHDQLRAITNAVKDNAPDRLRVLLEENVIAPEVLNKRHFLHRAAWLGYDQVGNDLNKVNYYCKLVVLTTNGGLASNITSHSKASNGTMDAFSLNVLKLNQTEHSF